MRFSLTETINLNDLRELMHFFYEAAGISVGVMDADQNWLVSIGRQSICTDFHWVNPKSHKNCLLTEFKIQEYLNSKKYFTYPCPNRLISVVIPILLDDTSIGFFFFGTVFSSFPRSRLFSSTGNFLWF